MINIQYTCAAFRPL